MSPWAAMEESSPPMVADSGWISVFLIYAPPPFRDASGTFIYWGFGQEEPYGAFDGRLGCSKEQKSIGGAPKGVGAPPVLFPSLRLRLRNFKAEFRQYLENNNPRKILGQFESV